MTSYTVNALLKPQIERVGAPVEARPRRVARRERRDAGRGGMLVDVRREEPLALDGEPLRHHLPR